MPAGLTLTQSTDAYIDQSAPDRTPNVLERELLISNAAGAAKRVLIFFNRPFSPGVTVFSAKLRLFQQDAWAGSTQLSVQRINTEWSSNRVAWNGQPTVTGPTATLTQSDTTFADMWEIDVTSIMQEVAAGAAWYGFRVITNRTVDGTLHKSNDQFASLRPTLIVTYGRPPEQPTDLRPGGGRAVSLATPTLMFNYLSALGTDPIAAVQVQMSQTVDVDGVPNGTVTDTGEVATEVPQITSPVSLTAGQTWYWRVRAKDASGLWSIWSQSDSFTRTAKGTLTITAPTTGIKSGTPTVSWTYVGQTQRAYEVFLHRWDTKEVLWTSGKITGSPTSVGIPLGAIKYDNLPLRVVVRVYDTIARESTPGDPAWAEQVWDGAVTYDAGVAPATGLGMVSDLILPVAHLTWSRSTQPDRWQIQRSDDGGVSWSYIADAPGASYFVSGTNYKFDDGNVGTYKQYQWRVLAVVGGNQAAASPTVGGTVKKTAPILCYTDLSQPVQFLNPSRDRNTLDVQELHVPLAGPPVVVTQRLGLLAGHMSGLLVDENTIGVSAKTLYSRFLGMRANAGIPLILYEGDESYIVVAYNMQTDLRTDTQGVTYFVEFDWVQIA